MDKLPKGWKVCKFMDVCSRITDGSHFSPKTKDNGFPYVTVKDISDSGEIDIKNCKKISENDFKELIKSNCQPYEGDLLLSKDGTVGKTTLVNNNEVFVVLSSLAILSPKPSIVHSKFLYLFLNSPEFQEKAISSKTGAAIKRIVLRNIKEFQLAVPPLPEQIRICSKLDSLFSRIDKSISLLEGNIKYTKALMASMLEEIYIEATKSSPLRSLDEICIKITDGSHFSPKAQGSGYPYITVKDIDDKGKIDFNNSKKISFESYQNLVKSGCHPQYGDRVYWIGHLKENYNMLKKGFVSAFGINYSGTLPKVNKSENQLQPIFEAFTNALEAIKIKQLKFGIQMLVK